MKYGAKHGVSIDVDKRSLDSARKTLAVWPNAVVREMSGYAIDYVDEFDIVYSIGVVHHLEHPRLALEPAYTMLPLASVKYGCNLALPKSPALM